MTPINPRLGFKALYPDDDSPPIQETQEDPNSTPIKYAGDILAIGEFSMISVLDITPDGLIWHKLSGGDSVFSAYSILNFIFPLLAMWIFFVMLYTLIPNSKVPITSAMLGALITSIIFLLFLYAFAVYVRSFSMSTMIIYRALAAVPLFLLYIYGIAMIILFGAEITATIQYKSRYLSVSNPFDESEFDDKNSFYKTVELLLRVYWEQKKSRKVANADKLEYQLRIDSKDFINILDKLVSHGYVLLGKEKEIVPCILPEDVNLLELYKMSFHESLEIPEGEINPLSNILVDKFHLLEEHSREVLGELNFEVLLEAYGKK